MKWFSKFCHIWKEEENLIAWAAFSTQKTQSLKVQLVLDMQVLLFVRILASRATSLAGFIKPLAGFWTPNQNRNRTHLFYEQVSLHLGTVDTRSSCTLMDDETKIISRITSIWSSIPWFSMLWLDSLETWLSYTVWWQISIEIWNSLYVMSSDAAYFTYISFLKFF